MRISCSILMLLVSVTIHSQHTKGIVSDYAKLISTNSSNKSEVSESLHSSQNMTSHNSSANSSGQLTMLKVHSKETNKLDRLSTNRTKITNDDIINEINRRRIVNENFQITNTIRVRQIDSLYNQIPIENFTKIINGTFRAHLFIKKKYSFSNDQEIVTEVPCLLVVEENRILQIYPYGKKGFALDYPKTQASNSNLSEGIVQYSNPKTEEVLTVVLLDPFLSDKPKQFKITPDQFGFVKLYATKKKDHNKLVWIQEIDQNGNIYREVSQQLVYAKNEIEASKMDINPIAINTEYQLYYFGKPVATTDGVLPLFLKVMETSMKPIKNNEIRLVRIMIYRD